MILFIHALTPTNAVHGRGLLQATTFHGDHDVHYMSDDHSGDIETLGHGPIDAATVGSSFDNTIAKALWMSLKTKLVYRTTVDTREGAKLRDG